MNVTTLNTTTLDGNVIIKKGGGGTPTPPSGGSTLEYLDVSGVEDLFQGQFPLGLVLAGSSYRCKFNHPNGSGIKIELYTTLSGWVKDPLSLELLAIEIDLNGNYSTDKYGQKSIEEYFLLVGVSQEQLDSIPRLTKEEFYNLD